MRPYTAFCALISESPGVLGELTLTGEVGVVPLAEDLVNGDSYRVREVQTSQLVPHGYAKAVIGVIVKERFGKSLVLTTENQVGIIGVFRVAVDVESLGGEIEKSDLRCYGGRSRRARRSR